MDFYSYVTGMIGQSGRRGANLQTMRISHPDIELFIEEKSDMRKQPFFEELAGVGININDYKWAAIADRLKSTSHSNVSVRINDKFMKAVKEDGEYELWFEFKDNAYPRISRMIQARVLWDKLMHHAWSSAEPGILNWDHIIRESPADQYTNLPEIEFTDPATGETKWVSYSFETVGLNPCAEETLSAFDSCNLGLFLLPAFVKNPYTSEASFDFEAYGEVIAMGVRAQDNIKSWDLPILPLEGNRIAGVLGRRISVGNTGLADALAMLGLRYDTDEAIQMAESIYDFLANAAYQTSARLAEEKGSFQIFDWERHKKSPFIQRLSKETQKLIRTKGLRNIGLLTQSPAGSLSIEMRNCTSGIEPLFLAAMSRSVKVPGSGDTVQYIVYHQGIQDALNINPDFDKSIYVEANSIDYHKRIKMQAAIQRHIDHSISSTVNLPNDATVEDVSQLYMEAFDSGLKGITVYRDGCRTGVLNSIKKEAAEPVVRRERPKTTDIKIHKVKYRNLNYMVLVGLADGKPIEVFGGLEDGLSLPTKYQSATLTKKSRGHYSLVVQLSDDPEDVLKVNNVSARFPAEDIMTITRLISLSMRNGVPVSEITDQLQKSAGGMFDAPAIFARVLKNYLEDEDLVRMAASKTCPQCGGDIEIRRESGCLTETCRNTKCGWVNSKCS
jgi:ribonucleoside-diphosphate reductase alpha chain